MEAKEKTLRQMEAELKKMDGIARRYRDLKETVRYFKNSL